MLIQDQKDDVFKKFYAPQTNRKILAESEGISRVTLYQWKDMYLESGFPLRMTQEEQKELLLTEFEELQKQVHQCNSRRHYLKELLNY